MGLRYIKMWITRNTDSIASLRVVVSVIQRVFRDHPAYVWNSCRWVSLLAIGRNFHERIQFGISTSTSMPRSWDMN